MNLWNKFKIKWFIWYQNVGEYRCTPAGVNVLKFKARRNIRSLPFQFNIIHGYFNLRNSGLTSLSGSPRVVHGYFSCTNNQLKSLEFCPKFVQGDFYCFSNKISPWEHRYLLFSEIQGRIKTETNELNLFFEKYQNQKSLIPEALKELRLLQIKWEQNHEQL